MHHSRRSGRDGYPRRGRIVARGAVAAATVVLLAGASPAAAPSTLPIETIPCVGVQFHGMWQDYSSEQRIQVLDRLAAAGIRTIRLDLGWSSFEEREGRISSWYVDRADAVVDAALERGFEVLGTLWATPAWANGGKDRSVPPSDASEFGRFAGWVAEHFEGRVAAWEIWNEPNHRDFFRGGPARYTSLLRVAYPAIKSADPAATVVLGGPVYNDTGWLKAVYRAGAKQYFDVLATHPYQAVGDLPPDAPADGTIWRLAHIEKVRDLMERFDDEEKEIWFTEFGWSSHRNGPRVKNWERGVSEARQAQYLLETIDQVSENYPYVTRVYWYNERNRATGNQQLDNYGLMRRDLAPKPAYIQLKDRLTDPVGQVLSPQNCSAWGRAVQDSP